MQLSRRATLVSGLGFASTIAAQSFAEPPPTREEIFKLLFQEEILGPVDPVPGGPLWQKADRIIDAAPRKGTPYRVADYFATGIPPRFRQAWKKEQLANPVIVEFWQWLNIGRTKPGDMTPWCAVFANWCLDRVQIPGTGSPASQSFRNWGNPVWESRDGLEGLSRARRGDIAVFQDVLDPRYGHVGFFMGLNAEHSNSVFILGGNQGSRILGGPEPLIGSRIAQDPWPIGGGPRPLLTIRTGKGLRDA